MRRYWIAALVSVFTLFAMLATAAPPKGYRLVTEERHKTLLSFLPETSDDWFNDLKSKHLIFYGEPEMPQAYQIWDGGLQGIHSPFYNISAAKPQELFGNPNIEFPWGTPAGLRRSPNFKSFKFVHLPRAIRWWSDRLPGDQNPTYQWRYPEGTIFGEALLVTDPKGWDHTFEIRVRIRGKDGWTVNAYRPFGSYEELVERVKELEPKWEDNSALVKFVNHKSDPMDGSYVMVNHHPTTIINRTSLQTHLPPLPSSVVSKLLDTTKFHTVLGKEWRKDEKGREGHAPTTTADYHIVPKHYEGAFMEVSSKKCMTCHNSVLKHARDFENFTANGQLRDWYGRVRGSDGIFSFHIFDPSCISSNGSPQGVAFRQSLIAAGLLKHWND